MRVRFTENFDWTPPEEPRVQIAYRADGGPKGDGVYDRVRGECGAAAIDAGKAVEAAQDPLDHDNDGRKGGSLPRAKKTDAQA